MLFLHQWLTMDIFFTCWDTRYSLTLNQRCHLDLLQTTGENDSVKRLNISLAKDLINKISRKDLPKDTVTEQTFYLPPSSPLKFVHHFWFVKSDGPCIEAFVCHSITHVPLFQRWLFSPKSLLQKSCNFVAVAKQWIQGCEISIIHSKFIESSRVFLAIFS